jgi:hypothetical protein
MSSTALHLFIQPISNITSIPWPSNTMRLVLKSLPTREWSGHNQLLSGNISSRRVNQIWGNYVLNHQLMLLSAWLTNEVMTSPRIKQDGSRMPIQRKRTREDLLALRNVFHGGVVDAAGLRDSHLQRTTW